jgi:hypothetical protein
VKIKNDRERSTHPRKSRKIARKMDFHGTLSKDPGV